MFEENEKCIISKEDKIFISYYKNFIFEYERDYIFKLFEKNIIYYTDEESQVIIYGNKIDIPRKQVAYGELGTTYTFSNVTVNAKDWNENSELCKIIKKIRDKVAKRFNYNPNFVLINRYENGDKSIGYHSDDEKDLIENSPIVGVSFGAEREILFKFEPKKKFFTYINNLNKKRQNKSLMLTNGSIFCIHYPTNLFWKHSIPKIKKVYSPRISLTFREMIKNNKK